MNWLSSVVRWMALRSTVQQKSEWRTEGGRESVGQVTVVKLDAIGDFILSTAFLRPLAERWADRKFTLVVRKPNGPLARQQFPAWEVVELPPREKAWRNVLRQPLAKRQLQRLPKADLLVDLRAFRDYSDAVVASWIPARRKLALANAYPSAWRKVTHPDEAAIYDQLVQTELPRPGEAQDLANHRVLGRHVLGDEVFEGPARPRLVIPASDADGVARALHEKAGHPPGDPYLIVAPGTSAAIKEYPIASLAEALRQGLGGYPHRLIIAGSPADRRTTEPLLQALHGFGAAYDATGLFSLPHHAALIGGARMVVTMDSSHVHFAGALDVPCVAVLGGGQFGEFGPWGESEGFRWLFHRLPCYGCQWHCIYDRPRCIDDIPVEQVAGAIRSVRAKAGL